jgi:type IV pilus assembly protein PilW
MNTPYTRRLLCPARTQRGFTLVELMVTVGIALFLLWGLTTVMQNVRTANLNQQGLAQLQDQERFALTVINDVVQSGGYVPADDATTLTATTALAATGPFQAGQAFFGAHAAAAPGDTLSVRYYTDTKDGVILCDGSTNQGVPQTFTNTFTVQAAGPGVVGGLYCQLQAGAGAAAPAVLLVTGVHSMTVYYGVKRDLTFNDYNVDTYLTADQMLAADWSNISAVRVILSFNNPLFGQPGQQQFIIFERVVEVMARGGVHT